MTNQIPDANCLIGAGGEQIHYSSSMESVLASGTNGEICDCQGMLANCPDWLDRAIHIIESSDDLGHVPLADESILYRTHVRKTSNDSDRRVIREK